MATCFAACGKENEGLDQSMQYQGYTEEELNYSEQENEPIKSYFRYKIVSVDSGKAIAVDSVSGQNVGLVEDNESLYENSAALWRLEKQESGGYSRCV